MREIDTCTYEHNGFRICFDGEAGVWTATNPQGEFLTTKGDLREAMIYIETESPDERREEYEAYYADKLSPRDLM